MQSHQNQNTRSIWLTIKVHLDESIAVMNYVPENPVVGFSSFHNPVKVLEQINKRLKQGKLEYSEISGRPEHEYETDGFRAELWDPAVYTVEIECDKKFEINLKEKASKYDRNYLNQDTVIKPNQIKKILLTSKAPVHRMVFALAPPSLDELKPYEFAVFKNQNGELCYMVHGDPNTYAFGPIQYFPDAYYPGKLRHPNNDGQYTWEDQIKDDGEHLTTWVSNFAERSFQSMAKQKLSLKRLDYNKMGQMGHHYSWILLNHVIHAGHMDEKGDLGFEFPFSISLIPPELKKEFEQINDELNSFIESTRSYLDGKDKLTIDEFMQVYYLTEEMKEKCLATHPEVLPYLAIGLKELKSLNGLAIEACYHYFGLSKISFLKLCSLQANISGTQAAMQNKLYEIALKHFQDHPDSIVTNFTNCKDKLENLRINRTKDLISFNAYFENYNALNELKTIFSQPVLLPELIDKLQEFLANRWQEIMKTPQAYTQAAFSSMTNLCMSLANIIAIEKKENLHLYHYLMPTITDFYHPVYDEEMTDLPLQQLVLSDDGTHLYPVKILKDHYENLDPLIQETTLLDPYVPYDGESNGQPISASTWDRILHHSKQTEALHNHYEQWLALKDDPELPLIGKALENLSNGLRRGGVKMHGKELNAASDAMEAILVFQTFLDNLDPVSKDKLFKLTTYAGETFEKIWQRITRHEQNKQLAVLQKQFDDKKITLEDFKAKSKKILDVNSVIYCTDINSGKVADLFNNEKYNEFLYFEQHVIYARRLFDTSLKNFTAALPDDLQEPKPLFLFELLPRIEYKDEVCFTALKNLLRSIDSTDDIKEYCNSLSVMQPEIKDVFENSILFSAIQEVIKSKSKLALCVLIIKLAQAKPEYKDQLKTVFAFLGGPAFGLDLDKLNTDVDIPDLTTPSKVLIVQRYHGVRSCIGAASVLLLAKEQKVPDKIAHVSLDKPSGLHIHFEDLKSASAIFMALNKMGLDSVNLVMETKQTQFGVYVASIEIRSKEDIATYVKNICGMNDLDLYDLYKMSGIPNDGFERYNELLALKKALQTYLTNSKIKYTQETMGIQTGAFWKSLKNLSLTGFTPDEKEEIVQNLMKIIDEILKNPYKAVACPFADLDRAKAALNDSQLKIDTTHHVKALKFVFNKMVVPDKKKSMSPK